MQVFVCVCALERSGWGVGGSYDGVRGGGGAGARGVEEGEEGVVHKDIIVIPGRERSLACR